MSTLAIAFSLAWGAATAYLGWLGIENRRLSHRLDAVETQVDETTAHGPRSRAA